MTQFADDEALAAIRTMLQQYFDGLYHSDSALLARVFHADARYICATGGDLLQRDMPEYFQQVDQRTAPAELGQARRDSIISIALVGANTALAVVNCAIAPRYFTDFLSLIYVEDRWQIIAKTFHFCTIEPQNLDQHEPENNHALRTYPNH